MLGPLASAVRIPGRTRCVAVLRTGISCFAMVLIRLICQSEFVLIGRKHTPLPTKKKAGHGDRPTKSVLAHPPGDGRCSALGLQHTTLGMGSASSFWDIGLDGVNYPFPLLDARPAEARHRTSESHHQPAPLSPLLAERKQSEVLSGMV